MQGLNALLTVLGASLAALVLCGLLLHTPGASSVDSIGLVRRFVAVLAVAAVLYLAAVWLVLREGGGAATLAIVLGAALLARVPALVGPPFLSSDLYRYIWDGRVQLAGFNPYRYIPADPALAALRDHAIFDHVNRRFYAHTIYPPAAQLMFRLLAAISQTPFAMKLASVGLEAVAVACLAATLRLCGQPPARVLLYAWNPLAIWSFAGNGHVDAEAIAFVAVTLFARAARRDGWAGAALGAATLVKFLPAAIGPALWRGRWRLPVVAILTIVLLYLPFIAVGPRRVLGFLGGYGVEEGLNDGQGIWLLAGLGDLAHLPRYAVPLYCIFSALALGAAAFAAANACGTDGVDRAADIRRFAGWAGFLAALAWFVLSPHYAWYFPVFAVFAVLRPSRALLWMSVAPLALYLSPWHEFFFWPSLVYAPAVVLFLVDEVTVVGRRFLRAPRERIFP
jgi:alpha-1,6-mannosyltransferase